MHAFKVLLNRKRLCVAGIGDDGVLTTTLTHVPFRRRHDIQLYVGGLLLPQNEHVLWKRSRLRVGDEVVLKVVEVESVDKPRKRFQRDPVAEANAEKRHLEKMAKKFGWKIIKPRNRK
ncbi:MAG TPA: hypothetical protein VNK23_16765 [Candidatus Dormibacteraeota bacterium]|nr:hypothetical protein [Candidatus Dormibacteraeota bacterium]